MSFFEVKTKVYFGRGEKDKLAQYLSEHGFSRCGVVVDKALLSYDVFKSLITTLERELRSVKVLVYDCDSEPTYGYLDTVKNFFGQDEIECLIGMGGGSAIDTAKGLAVLIKNPVKKAVELRGFPKISNVPVPVVAVPTIAGTGTEVTYFAVFIDEIEKRKLGINTTFNFPVFSLLDPELTLTAPLKQSLSTALDCLVHCLESFMSKKATSFTRPLSVESFYYVFSGLRGLLKDPGDIRAREQLMAASYMAGIALMNSSSGPSGAFSYPLGSLFKVPHGLAGAFLLQYILDYNLSEGYTDFYLLYDRVNDRGSLSRNQKAEQITRDIAEIIEKAGIPRRLSGFGIGKKDISDFARLSATGVQGAFELNPVGVPKEGLDEFLAKVL